MIWALISRFFTSFAVDCEKFREECKQLANPHSGMQHVQCWGTPRYYHCDARDGTVFNIPGYDCKHPKCPTNGAVLSQESKISSKGGCLQVTSSLGFILLSVTFVSIWR